MVSTRIFFLAALLSLPGCKGPNTDPGPASVPDVRGIIEGAVLYVGPRPECDYEGETPTAVRGNVIMLLFFNNNPPPPAGSAAAAVSLLVVPGRELFGVSDCLPAAPTPEDRAVIVTRSAAFEWPDIALAAPGTERVDYQIRAFFDHDQDFIPFFSVRRLATKGDIAGGAFVNTSEVPPQFALITFQTEEEMPFGEVVSGVAVTLGAPVNTELPACRIGDGTQALDSENTVPNVTDPVAREQMLWDMTHMRLTMLDPTNESFAATLAAAGMSIDPHPSGYGWFTAPVDANRDGEQDLHPTLGAGGVRWEHPIVILRRARNPVELGAGIPDAVIIASVRPSQTLTKDTFYPDIDIAVVPIAAVTLNASDPTCRVPYIAPGNVAELYERIPAECQEMPTGNYDVNVLTGIAGGTLLNYREQIMMEMPTLTGAVLDNVVHARTDNDWVILGGQYSSQAWSIPNELGCPDPLYRPVGFDSDGNPIAVSQLDADPFTTCDDLTMTVMQPSQGPAGRFSVVDPQAGNAPPGTDNTPGHGIAECQTALSVATMGPRAVNYMPIAAQCCEPIRHLCGLPLCPLRDAAVLPNAGGGRAIREIRDIDVDYTVSVDEDGDTVYTALCVPFLMPASCCQ